MAFNAKELLDQLLKSGQSVLEGRGGVQQPGRTTSEASKQKSRFGGFGGGMAAGSALGLLMGNKRLRKFGGGALSHGGAAALGAFAYRAYQQWQETQGKIGQVEEPRTLDRIPVDEAEHHSRILLQAIVGASKADGHVDDRERKLIEEEIDKVQPSAELRDWLDDELRKPVDPSAVASAAESPEMASEMYLASRLIIDTENFMERAYLDELARRMKLDPSLQAHLEREFARVDSSTPVT